MAKAPNIVVLDPTSLVGEELVPRLAQAYPDARLSYYHSQPGGDHLIVEVAGEARAVPPLADGGDLGQASLVIITATPSRQVRERLSAFFATSPHPACLDLAHPSVLSGPRAFHPQLGGNRVAFPDPALLLPAKVLEALRPLSPRRAFFSVLAPVSVLGGEALDELAAQAVARLSGEKPKSHVLPQTLAFDALPYPENREGGLESDLSALFPDLEVRVHPLLAGIFHAHSLQATVELAHRAADRDVRHLLAGAGFALHRGRKPLTPSQVAGHAEPLAALLRAEGFTVHLWAAGDHLLLQTQAALEAVQSLVATWASS